MSDEAGRAPDADAHLEELLALVAKEPRVSPHELRRARLILSEFCAVPIRNPRTIVGTPYIILRLDE